MTVREQVELQRQIQQNEARTAHQRTKRMTAERNRLDKIELGDGEDDGNEA